MPFFPVSRMVHWVPRSILFNAIKILECVEEYYDLVVKLSADISENEV